jgi:N-acetylmuramoyl-L-alanine amidase
LLTARREEEAMPGYVIDCGHGGHQPRPRATPFGGVGPTGLREKDVTLDIGRRVARALGDQAVLTRNDDSSRSIAERTSVALRYGSPVFISIHANQGPPGERGPETWIHPRGSTGSRMLAESIQHELAELGGPNRGIRRGELAVLAPERLPPHAAACLIEVDYLSDPEGERRLRDPSMLDAIAQAIARGARRRNGFGGAQGLDLTPSPSTTGIGDFWAVWCVTESCFLPEIYLRQSSAQTAAQRHIEIYPDHRAAAVLVRMGTDLNVQTADGPGTNPPSTIGYGQQQVPDINIQNIYCPRDFTLPNYQSSTGQVTFQVTPPPPQGSQAQVGQLSVLGTVTNQSGTAVELRCAFLRQGGNIDRASQVLAGHYNGNFEFNFDNVARNGTYGVVLDLNTSDPRIRVDGNLSVMMTDPA